LSTRPPEEPRVESLDHALGERLAAGRIGIPLLPAVAASVIQMVNDPDSDVAALAALIRNDPALAGHVLRHANSPLARAGAPLVSLQQAITRLGMRSVADIAFAACMGPRLFKAPAYAGLIERIWRESLATALWSREIARALRRNVEVSFLCGLLHAIGRPVVLQAVQEQLGADTGALADAQLAALLDGHARAAGLQVAVAWHLPEPVAAVIDGVGDFEGATRERALVAMVCGARALALGMLQGGTIDAGEVAGLAAMAEINLYRADIERLLEQAEALQATLREMNV
jgi:HD-like signal output (HDOD) protein